MKLYTKSIDSCGICQNLISIPNISPNSKAEFRCRKTTYRNNVYRLIHKDGPKFIPEWCTLEDEVDPVI